MACVSCITVTQDGRRELFADAVRCLSEQTHRDKELVVVHDGDVRADRELRAIVASEAPGIDASIRRCEPALLGDLRQLGVETATGEFVCQWDDDDLSHPTRLELQLSHLDGAAADACFLTEQLHLYAASGELYVEDWTVDRFPLCYVPGSLLARRRSLPPYRSLSNGEDTQLVFDLLSGGRRVTGLQDSAHLFVYVFHGTNSFDERHHRLISATKAKASRGTITPVGLRSLLGDYPVVRRRCSLAGTSTRADVMLGRR